MFKIAILGCGVVGSGVADILISKSASISIKFDENVSLSKILDVRDLPDSAYAKYLTKNKEDIFNDSDIKLVVITIGGNTIAYEYAKKALESGRHVVTSNKEVVAAHARELTKLAFENNVRFLYEASTGGGIPIIRPINICLSGNDVTEIMGILNGTTNYILTKMKKDGMSFEDALAKAQQKGYAEADPTADVDGHDAARKIAILSTLAYDMFVDYKDISCKGIRNISLQDIDLASKAGFTIKLIARSSISEKGIKASVEPLMLSNEHMLSTVNSSYNAIFLKGSYVGDSMFYGKGAGKLPTASAVVGDIIDILGRGNEKSLPNFVSKEAVLDKTSIDISRYLLRINTKATKLTDDELKSSTKKIFGSTSNFSGKLQNNAYVCGIITGIIAFKELEHKISDFEKLVNVEVENIIKIID